jgi:hypothetical protein
MATENANVEVKLQNVRLSFAHIWTAKAFGDDPDGKKKFNCAFLIPKSDTKQIEAIKAAAAKAKQAKWGANPPKIGSDKLCLRDGDEQEYDGYAGHYFLTASNAKRPVIVDRNKTPLTEADGKPYSGSYVNAVVRIWCQDNKWGKRINASLEGIQFYKDGDAFGAPPLSEDAFEEFSDDDEGGAPASAGESNDLL